MKKLLLLPSLLFVLTASAQTAQYKRIETTHFKGDKLSSKVINYKSGNISMGDSFINIEGLKSFTIVSKGQTEAEDEGYYSRTLFDH
jgi:hypothetical protein